MRNKEKTFIAALLVCTIVFAGCSRSTGSSSSPSNTVKHTQNIENSTDPVTDTVTEAVEETQTSVQQQGTVTESTEAVNETAATIQTDDSAVITQNADGSFNAVFGDRIFTMTFPASWAGRIVIEDYKIYSKLCWDSDPGNKRGKLLTIFQAEDEDMHNGIPYSYLLGTASDEYIIAFTPTDVSYDVADTVLHEEYTSLFSDIQSVISSARCVSSPDFSPIDISGYDSAMNFSYNSVGSWEAASGVNSAAQFTPYIVFRERDGAFGYVYGMNGASGEYESGSYLVNINVDDYQWNSENWGDFGLVFMDGSVFRFTYYATAPGTISFEKLIGDAEYDYIAEETWMFSSDFQDFDVDYND